MTLDEQYDYMVSCELFTVEEIHLVTYINGWNEQTFNDMVYVRYGYRSLEQMIECEGWNE